MFFFEEINNITFYKSAVFDDKELHHFFSTKSCGNAQNEENRRAICDALDIKRKNLVIPEQKHTYNIKIIDSSDEDVSDCDGLITQTPGLGLMLLFADCVPVIMYAPDKHVIAVIHAGCNRTSYR